MSLNSGIQSGSLQYRISLIFLIFFFNNKCVLFQTKPFFRAVFTQLSIKIADGKVQIYYIVISAYISPRVYRRMTQGQHPNFTLAPIFAHSHPVLVSVRRSFTLLRLLLC